jgi:catechol 2,3-dioxygenase-like lactoylglutathione lyase family enzyme
MNFAYTILYVQNVTRSLDFYEKAFGFTRRFLNEERNYGELNTAASGGSTLSFSNVEFMKSILPIDFTQPNPANPPAAFEIGFATPDVPATFRKAVAAGATPVLEPVVKPWGQTVAYVRDLDGVLIEICTPMP